MALLDVGNDGIAGALIPSRRCIAACICTRVPDASSGALEAELFLDATIIGGIVLASLIGVGRGLRQHVSGSSMHLQSLCCKRNVPAPRPSWLSQLAVATRRTMNRGEKCILIDVSEVHAQNRNIDGMIVLKEVENTWLPRLDMQDYRCIIQCLAKGGDPVAAQMWLRRSMHAGFRPFHSTFDAVISSYIKKKRLEHALQVADEMGSAARDYDTATYNMLIDVWARKGDAHRAQSWMRKMLDEKIQPNIIGFSTVMRACAEAGWLQDLDGWFETSQSYGFQLDLIGFRSVLRVFAKKQDAVNAAKWLDVMIEKGVQPGIIEYMEVFKPIFAHCEVVPAIRCMDQMLVAGVQFLGMMIRECIVMAVKHGYHSKAQTWADECAARKVGIGEAAKIAMVAAGLTVPAFDMGSTQNPSQESVNAGAKGGSTSLGSEANMEARRTAPGCHYMGFVRESNPYQYGFIACAATYEVFKKDVWFCQAENKEGLTKGQRLLFRLWVDDKGRPRACDMTT